jgi:hypothetical protein
MTSAFVGFGGQVAGSFLMIDEFAKEYLHDLRFIRGAMVRAAARPRP